MGACATIQDKMHQVHQIQNRENGAKELCHNNENYDDDDSYDEYADYSPEGKNSTLRAIIGTTTALIVLALVMWMSGMFSEEVGTDNSVSESGSSNTTGGHIKVT